MAQVPGAANDDLVLEPITPAEVPALDGGQPKVEANNDLVLEPFTQSNPAPDPRETEYNYNTFRDVNPDAAAQFKTIADKNGMTFDQVVRNKDAWKQADDTAKLFDSIKNNPKTLQWFGDPANMAVGKDDALTLAEFEKLHNENTFGAQAYKALINGLSGFNAGLLRTPAALYSVAAIPQNLAANIPGLESLRVRTPDFLVNNPITNFYDEVNKSSTFPELERSAVAAIGEGDFAGAGRTLALQLIQNAPTQAAVLFGGAAAAAGVANTEVATLAGMGAVQGGNVIKRATDVGQDPAAAGINVLVQGTAEGLFEKVGTFGLLKHWESAIAKEFGKGVSKEVMKTVGKTMAASFAGEATEEAATQFAQSFSDYVTGADSRAMDGIVEKMLNAGLLGGLSGTTMTSPTAFMAGAQQALYDRQIDMHKSMYEAMGANAEASKVRARLPELYQKHVEEVTKNGPVENVYMPTDDFNTYAQSAGTTGEQLAKDLGVSEHFQEGAAQGMMKVPMSKWLGVVDTEHYKGLSQDITFDPSIPTQRQKSDALARIKEMDAENQVVTEKLIAEQEQVKTEHDLIVQDVLDMQRNTFPEKAGDKAWEQQIAAEAALVAARSVATAARRADGKTALDVYQSWRLGLNRDMGEKPNMAKLSTQAGERLQMPAGGARFMFRPSNEDKAMISDMRQIIETAQAPGEVLPTGVDGVKTVTFSVFPEWAKADAEKSFPRKYVLDLLDRAESGKPMSERMSKDLAAMFDKARVNMLNASTPMSFEDYAKQFEPVAASGDTVGLTDYVSEFDTTDPETLDFLMQRTLEEKNLVAMHNLRAEALVHADKMGGLAVPSLSIGKKDHPLDGFGDITLIASKDLVDPKVKSNKVFNADIYSPRYPSVTYSPSTPEVRAARKKIDQEAADIGSSAYAELDENALKNEGMRVVTESAAVQLKYLRSIGKDVAIPVMEIKTPTLDANPSIEQYTDPDTPVSVLLADSDFVREFIAAADKIADDVYQMNLESGKSEAEAREDANYIRGLYVKDGVPNGNFVRDLQREIGEKKNTGKPDRYEARKAIREAIAGVRDDFNTWAENEFAGVISGEKLRTGEDRNGNSRYIPHTLENVVRIMKRELQSGEGFNYGVGNLRASVAKRYKSIKEIQGDRDKVLSKAEFEKVKEFTDAEFFEITEGVGSLSTFVDVVIDGIKHNNLEGDLKEFGFGSVDVDRLKAFLDVLTNMPTEYFEAKVQRAVGLGEFSGAVIPKDTPADARKVLDRNGIPYAEYDPSVEGSRAKAIADFAESNDLLFQSGGQTQTEAVTGNRGTFDPNDPNILHQSVSSLGFYSAAEQAITSLPMNRMTGAQFRAAMEKAGVKKEEMEWTGLADLAGQDVVTKAEALEVWKQNAVEVKETVLGKELGSSGSVERLLNGKYRVNYPGLQAELFDTQSEADAALENNRRMDGVDATKFSGYQLPGGENYREILLTLPPKDTITTARSKSPNGWGDTDGGNMGVVVTGDRGNDYRSSHFSQPNILAHVRANDRTVDGKKVLFLEEVQSDWHQAGRKRGYSPERIKRLEELNKQTDALLAKGRDATSEEKALWASLMNERQPYLNDIGVPDAPFKKTWHELAMKRMMRYAVENGYDSIAWTTGAQQAERYDLSKQVKTIDWTGSRDGSKTVSIAPKTGNDIEFKVLPNGETTSISGNGSGNEFTGKKLEDVVGKDVAEKILASEYGSLSGSGLSVGGQGMSGFYDKILVDSTNKLVKKYGAKVGDLSLDGSNDEPANDFTITGSDEDGYFINKIDASGDIGAEVEGPFEEEADAEAAKERLDNEKGIVRGGAVHALDITPHMRDAVMTGLPLFQPVQIDKGKVQGAVNIGDDGQAIVTLFEKANKSTFMHEMSHVWLKDTLNYVSAGSANEAVLADWQILKDWLKFDDSQTDFTREQQEQFARGFEQYLLEGKAPSDGLRRVFASFRRWMTKIYGALVPTSIKINDDVRGVMGRMLATENEIAFLEAKNGKTAELVREGLDPKVAAQYDKLRGQAHEEAVSILLKPQMKELTPEYKEKIAMLRKKYENEAGRAMAQDERRQTYTLVEKNFAEDPKKIAGEYLDAALDDEQTAQFELFAEARGYETGEDLARGLIGTPSLEDDMAAYVERKMRENGDIKDGHKLTELGVEAMHNEQSEEVLALEAAILERKIRDAQTAQDAKKLGEDKNAARKTGAIMTEMEIERMKAAAHLFGMTAKQQAKDILATKTLKEAAAFMPYFTAQRDAAARAAKAMASGDYAEATKWKQRELLNHALAREAFRNKRTIEKAMGQIDDIRKRKVSLFKEQENFVQAAEILRRFGFARKDYDKSMKTESLQSWSERMANAFGNDEVQDAPVNIAEWIYAETVEKSPDQMTVGELLDVKNALKNIVFVGNSIDKMFRLNEKASVQATAEKIAQEADTNVNAAKVLKAVENELDRTLKTFSKYSFSLKTMDTLINKLDGYKDFGAVYDIIMRPVKTAADRESVLRREKMAEIEKLFGRYTKQEMKRFKTLVTISEFGTTLTHSELMAMALNLGATHNRDRLFETAPVGFNPSFVWDRTNSKYDRAIVEQSVMKVLSERLTAKDWETVQGVWDLIESLWSPLQAMHKEMTGFELAKRGVQAFQVRTPQGLSIDMKGGYYPLAADSRTFEKAAVAEETATPLYKDLNAGWKAATKQGHTKQVTNAAYSVSLNLGYMTQHISDVAHDIEFRPIVYDMNRLLKNQTLAASLNRNLGRAGAQAFDLWGKALATGGSSERLGSSAAASWVRAINNRVATVAVLGRVSVIVQNLANPFLAPGRVAGFGWSDMLKGILGRGVCKYWVYNTVPGLHGEARKMQEFVWSKSSFMRDRSENPEYSLKDFSGTFLDKAEFGPRAKEFMLGLISATDDFTNVPLWLEAYNKKIDDGATEAKAIEYADLLVQRTTGSGRKYDVAKILRGDDIERMFSKLYTFWNVEYNNWEREVGKLGKAPVKNAGRFSGFVAGRLMFIVASAALAGQLPDEDDEMNGDSWKKILKMFLSFPVSFFPIFREVGNSVLNIALGLPDFGIRPAPMTTAFEMVTKTVRDAVRAGEAGDAQPLLEDATRLISYGTGWVPEQVNAWFWNAYDYVNNYMEPEFEDIYRRRPKKER